VIINTASIGAYSKSHVPPFLLTYEIFNFNVHNCLVDSGASSNIMPYSVFQRINDVPQMTKMRIIQLDRMDVKVKGELKYVLIRLASTLECIKLLILLLFTYHKDMVCC
jgi:hypothetical protein